MVKFLFIADIHANKERYKSVVKLLQQIQETIEKHSIDYCLIGGDFWDSVISNTKNSGFVDIVKEMNLLCQKTNVIAITGTPFHEPDGSMSFLEAIGGQVYSEPTLLTLKENIKLLCIPELRRSHFITNSVQETTNKMRKALNDACNNQADIVMYHGEFSGALLDNGVSVKSEVQLSKSMLDKTNAQIALCGHLHLPQEPAPNVYYVGSPIPKNAGETHKGSYIVFSVENGKVGNVQRINTNFPTFRTFQCSSLKEFNSLSNFDFKNVNLKIKLSLTKDEKKFFKVKEKEKILKEATQANSVSINVILQNEISVRSKEIVKTNSLYSKLKIYSEVNQLNLTSEIIAKAKDIEDNMLIKYISPSHSFELLSISLKGCKCIKGKDEVNIDFSKCSDGVVLLIGENGSGKSSLAENCLPFPCMLTRSGTLRSFFYQKDSHRIVVYRDETNKYYKFTIQLAAHIENGLIKYFVETSEDGGVTWQSVSGVDGSLESYKKYVEEQFGSLELYLRTAFFTTEKTKGVSDIASATKTERITLLSELLNFDSISEMHDIAKEKMKGIEKEILKFDNLEETKKQCENDFEIKKETEKVLNLNLKEVNTQLDNLENKIKETRKKESEYNRLYSQFKNAVALKQECFNRVKELSEHLEKLKEHKEQNDFFKFHKEQIQEYKKQLEYSKPILDKLNELSKKQNNITDELLELTDKLNDAKNTYDNEKNKYDNIDLKIYNNKQDMLNVSDNCPTCGAKLSERKKKDIFKINEHIQDEIDALKEFKIRQKVFVSDAKKDYTSLKKKVDNLKLKKNELSDEFTKLDNDYQATRLYLSKNSELEKFTNYIEVNNLETDIENVSQELNSAKDMLETLNKVDFVDYKQQLEDLENKKKSDEELKLQISMNLASIQTQINQLEETLKCIATQEEKRIELQKEYSEYSFLEKAYSNTGIQALELEAVAPDIAEITNTILQESYGDKFSVSFKTLKEKKSKIMEDFSIEVTNHETGWTIPIEQLSKGEKVWVTQALYYAFSLIRMQKTNFSFRVRFVDESDGGLDSEHRLHYLKMIQSAHKAGDARLTVMITHSQEIKDIIQQTIKL